MRELLKNYYDLTDEAYAELTRPLSELCLPDPFALKGVLEAAALIQKTCQANGLIAVYGDYDCDGICATAIMKKTFALLGHEKLITYIPSRYLDGYGLTSGHVKRFIKAGVSLIITVDNGIACLKEVALAKEKGLQVIVTDHHALPEGELPSADAIIHPLLCGLPLPMGCGALMALYLSRALLGRYDDHLLTLAGLATVSDMMDLEGTNRTIVRLALHKLAAFRYPSLLALLPEGELTEQSFGLSLAPKINAVGRLLEDESVNDLVDYLLLTDPTKIREKAAWIEEVNTRRKELTKKASELPLDVKEDEPALVVVLPVKEGLAGLLANRLLDRYKKPVCVFSEDARDPSCLIGSLRSKKGFDVNEALLALQDHLLSGGGHERAGGCTIRKADFLAFKSALFAYADAHPSKEEEPAVIPIALSDVNETTYRLIRELAPYGKGFEEPLFLIEGVLTKYLRYSTNGEHLLSPLTYVSRLVGFNMPREVISQHEKMNVRGHIRLSVFHQRRTIEFQITSHHFPA